MNKCSIHFEKSIRSIAVAIGIFIFMELGVTIISKEIVLLPIVSVLSAVQVVVYVISLIKKQNKYDPYRQYGLLGVYNSFVFSVISSFLIGRTWIENLVVLFILLTVSFVEIIVFEVLVKKFKNKPKNEKNNHANNEDKQLNIIICVFVVAIFLTIKFFKIDILLIFKVCSTVMAIVLMSFYIGIIVSRDKNNQGTEV